MAMSICWLVQDKVSGTLSSIRPPFDTQDSPYLTLLAPRFIGCRIIPAHFRVKCEEVSIGMSEIKAKSRGSGAYGLWRYSCVVKLGEFLELPELALEWLQTVWQEADLALLHS